MWADLICYLFLSLLFLFYYLSECVFCHFFFSHYIFVWSKICEHKLKNARERERMRARGRADQTTWDNKNCKNMCIRSKTLVSRGILSDSKFKWLNWTDKHSFIYLYASQIEKKAHKSGKKNHAIKLEISVEEMNFIFLFFTHSARTGYRIDIYRTFFCVSAFCTNLEFTGTHVRNVCIGCNELLFLN